MPEKFKSNISKVKEMYPNNEVIIWDEKRLREEFGQFEDHAYLRIALKKEKVAFLTDYFRVKILYKYGGAYLDTDMIPVRTICNLDKGNTILSFEFSRMVSTAIMITLPNAPIFKKMIDAYDMYNLPGFKSKKLIVNNKLITYFLKRDNGLKSENTNQKLEHEKIILYKREILSSDKDYGDTFFIHDHTVSWAHPVYRFIVVRGLRFFYKNEKILKPILNRVEKGYDRKLKKNFEGKI